MTDQRIAQILLAAEVAKMRAELIAARYDQVRLIERRHGQEAAARFWAACVAA